jgi:23S rRNA pseudouridine1911/1915/1917 synthase
MRLDQWLAMELEEEVSRSSLQKWIRQGNIAGPQGEPKCSTKIRTGELYKIEVPRREALELVPDEMDLRIVFEDEDLAVVVKPPGIAVHPGPGESGHTLVNGLIHRWKDLPGMDLMRPGIVHRLDRDTEGLLIVAKNDRSLWKLSEQFQLREVEKEYNAWLLASPGEVSGTVDLPIARHPVERTKMRIDSGGRNAITLYEIKKSVVSKKGRKYSFAGIRILTGRTHQIRVHMAHLGAPVVGDPLYSRSAREFSAYGLLLFARRLSFRHPVSGKSLSFELSLPERFLEFERKCPNY